MCCYDTVFDPFHTELKRVRAFKQLVVILTVVFIRRMLFQKAGGHPVE